MSKDIATLDKALGQAAKLHRLLREAGLTEEALQLPIDDPRMRERLVILWNTGCSFAGVREMNFGDCWERPTLLADWRKFYKNVFKIDRDFIGLRIPPKPEGDWRLLIIAEGMSPARLIGMGENLFGVRGYTMSHTSVTSDRVANKDYCVWVRNQAEADTEIKDGFAKNSKGLTVQSITLEEQLVYEFKYFSETGKHLDINGTTYCLGSRSHPNQAPSVRWWVGGGGEVYLDWYLPHDNTVNPMTREVVSA